MRIRSFAIIASLSLGGCAASIPPVQVTRFHIDRAIAPGTISAAALPPGLEQGAYQAAVARELARVGFAPASGDSRYAFSVDVQRDTREAAVQRSPVSIGIGGGTGGYGGGLGGGISFGLGGNRSRQIVVTRLSVRLTERAGGATVWEGRAETQSPSSAPAAQPGLAADKLAVALFKDFPGESGRTITVP